MRRRREEKTNRVDKNTTSNRKMTVEEKEPYDQEEDQVRIQRTRISGSKQKE